MTRNQPPEISFVNKCLEGWKINTEAQVWDDDYQVTPQYTYELRTQVKRFPWIVRLGNHKWRNEQECKCFRCDCTWKPWM